MDFDDSDDIMQNNDEKLPTSIVINYNDEHSIQSSLPVTSPVILDYYLSSSSSSSSLEEQLEEADNSVSSSSSSSSSSSQSQLLNPNSSIDNLDLPGIACLKVIFPEESTDALRKIHYQNIILNKPPLSLVSSPSPVPGTGIGTVTTTTKENDDDTDNNHADHDDCKKHSEKEEQKPEIRYKNIPTIDLPDDFLRLPKTVAVLRKQQQRQQPSFNNNIEDDNLQDYRTYEFIHEMETRALEEYHLAGATVQRNCQGQNSIEFCTYVVDKDDRGSLGMTLQEVIEEGDHLRNQQREFVTSKPGSARHVIIRYGLMVVGFLPDPKKIQNGEVSTRISLSPAEISGVQHNDVVIGINGVAFLLQVPLASSSSYTIDRRSDQYRIQKEKIIQSIQKSETPAVLHIRRMKSGRTTTSERSATSLLDTVTFDMEENGIDSMFGQPEVPVVYGQQQQQQQKLRQSPIPYTLRSSSSSAFFTPSPTRTPSSSRSKPSSLVRHPLSIVMAQRKLIRSGEDEWRITRRLHQFTERSRQWESSNSLRIVISKGGVRVSSDGGSSSLCLAQYFDPNDLPPDMADLMIFTQDETSPMQRIETQDKCHKESNTISCNIREEHDGPQKLQSHFEAKCTPSTPLLPIGSPLIPIEYLQAFYGSKKAEEIRSDANYNYPSAGYQSTARRLFRPSQALESIRKDRYITNNRSQNAEDMTWIPLYGIRKSLSSRIVNSFVESNVSNVNSKTSNSVSRIAYTMWVYDIESGREWYAPIRYWQNFSDLHKAALSLLPTTSNMYKELSNLKFPKEPAIPNNINGNGVWGASVFGNRRNSSAASPLSSLQRRRRQKKNEEFENARQQTCRLLEEFLRELLGTIYICEPLHPNIAEIALYVQSFLGVEAGLEDCTIFFSDRRKFKSLSERIEDETRQLLKRSIQRYSWRIFLLHTIKAIIKDFVDAARDREPKLKEIECMEAGTKLSLKTRAMRELGKIQAFLDQLVDLIFDGCNDDLRSIAKRREFSTIGKYLIDGSYWDRLVRESIREQVEIEVYVPLRSVVSRLLVNGWRHDDMEAQFKIKELRKRPQGIFRIDKISPSHWQSVARILKQGVGMSTLPCVKLRAIVDAAREISQLYERENSEQALLGADKFLPIFIFCVVQAEMERPCALCVLLQNLCDRINRIGEIGYFLASFEAAVAHIQEIDLTDDRESMLSFLTVPLTEVSLNDE